MTDAPKRERVYDTGGRKKPKRAEREGKPAEPPTEETLRQALLRYLERYDGSRAQLRAMLRKKLPKELGAPERAELERTIDALLERFAQSHIIDDRRLSESLVRGQRARGASARKIEGKLRQRGVAPETIATALGEASARGDDELEAAQNYARRRRLAARHDLSIPAERQKALAALARQGFSFDVARRALALQASAEGDE